MRGTEGLLLVVRPTFDTSLKDIIEGAEHDEIFFSVMPKDIIESVTPEMILSLVRCGVRLNEDRFFCMYV